MKRGEIVGNRKVGNSIVKGRVTYKKLFEEFYNSLQIRGRAEQTLISYKYHSKYFVEFIGEEVYCDEITVETLENYILYIKNTKKISNAVTINSYLRNISPILKYGMKKGYILRDFLIPVVKEQETFKEVYTQEELKELLKKPKEREFVTLRTWAIIWTLASTGIRARELRELKVGAVDLLNRTIAVNVTKNKKARYLPISNSLAEVLEEYLQIRVGENNDYLFPSVYNNKLASSSLQKGIKNYCNDKGVNKQSLHLFRHTFITNAVNKNVSPLILQKITGHSTMKELNRYYNAKTIDMINIIDDIAPKANRKENYFKNKKQ